MFILPVDLVVLGKNECLISMFLLQIQKKKSFVFSVFSATEFPQQSFGEGADLFVDIIEVAGVWGKMCAPCAF